VANTISHAIGERVVHRAVIESGAAIKVADRADATQLAEMMLSKLGISKTDVHQIQKNSGRSDNGCPVMPLFAKLAKPVRDFRICHQLSTVLFCLSTLSTQWLPRYRPMFR